MKYIPKRIKDVSIKWFNDAPFFNEFLIRSTYKDSKEIPSIAVSYKDRTIKIYVNINWINKLSDEELEGVLVHEVFHILNKSLERGSGKVAKLWNLATDIVNNEEILKSSIGGIKLELPKNGMFLKDLKDFNEELLAEEVYNFLFSQDGQSGQNSQDGQDKNLTIDDHSMLDTLSDEHAKILVDEIINDAKSHNFGSITSNLENLLKLKLEKNKINLFQEISKEIKKSVQKGKVIKREDWSKINRRGNKLLPGKRGTTSNINVFIDTSTIYDTIS